jgi:hypothetical protein
MENLPAKTKASRVLSVDTLLGQVDVVFVVHAVLYNKYMYLQYSRQYEASDGTQDGACSSTSDGDDHDAEWSEEDGNQRTGGHQTRTSQSPTPTKPNPIASHRTVSCLLPASCHLDSGRLQRLL